MDRKAALKFIDRRAQEATWEQVAKEIGEETAIVYGWWRRGSVPKWRVPAVAAAAAKIEQQKAQ